MHLRVLEWYLWFGGTLGFLWSYSLQTPKTYPTQLTFAAGLVLSTQHAHHLWAQRPWGIFWAGGDHASIRTSPAAFSCDLWEQDTRSKHQFRKSAQGARHRGEDQSSPSWGGDSTSVLSYKAWLSRTILRSWVAYRLMSLSNCWTRYK